MANREDIQALAKLPDAELEQACRVRIELARSARARLENDMAHAAWFACLDSGRTHLYHRALAAVHAAELAQQQRQARGVPAAAPGGGSADAPPG